MQIPLILAPLASLILYLIKFSFAYLRNTTSQSFLSSILVSFVLSFLQVLIAIGADVWTRLCPPVLLKMIYLLKI